MERYVREDRLPGGVILVARHGKIAFLDTFGARDREARVPMRDDSMFRIASQTKAIVSVGVMMLEEDGKLVISDPVWKYLPEFRHTTVAVPYAHDPNLSPGDVWSQLLTYSQVLVNTGDPLHAGQIKLARTRPCDQEVGS